MQANFSDEKLVREYLLGFLPGEERERIERRFLADSEFESFVNLVEDEIIDEYLDDAGDLTEGDRRAIEDHFLRPPERQRKLAFARMLRSRLQSKEDDAGIRPLVPPPLRPPLFSAGASAALLALVIITAGSALYIVDLRRNLQIEVAKQGALQTDLAKKQERIESLEERVRATQSGTELLAVDLNAAASRGASDEPRITLHPETRWIEARIPLVDEPAPYSVAIRTAQDVEVLSIHGLKPETSHGGSQLAFPIPAQLLPPGEYTATLSAGQGTRNPMTRKYIFTVSK
ncbi:MAG: hypothetical protein LAP21_20100 [Acidobacteriia bacterium]|nr:hypothetical protein [Terriglobia bacterium]